MILKPQMKKHSIFIYLLFIFTLSSCVRDTDFSQAEEVTLTPVVDLNFIFFNLNQNDFFDPSTNLERLTVTDTTEIRFLDDSGIQESLKRAEFTFKYTNSFAQNIETTYQFLSQNNDTTYTTNAIISSGSINTPQTTTVIEIIEGPQIANLTQANKVVVSITLTEVNKNTQGVFNLKSKATYFLEIKERD